MVRPARALLALALFAPGAGACRGRGAPASPAPAPAAATPPPATPPPPARAAAPDGSAAASSFYADRFSRRATVPEMTELGRRLFFDVSLSASGKMSCSTCHDPRFGYGPPNARAVQLGGPDGKHAGTRAAPGLRYLQTVPPFSEHHFDEAVEDSTDQGPTGGHTWDGRADTTHDQARLPLTSPLEMANPDIASVVAKVEHGPLGARFRAVFGDDVFGDPVRGSTAVLKCLEVFQQSPDDLYPYTSRYDAYLRRQGTLSPAEQRGLALFNDPKKGNCASCHPSQVRHGGFPNFTDFGYNAIGVPRNREIPANADPAFHDLGLCGPLRTDLADHQQYCGLFRVPTVRNAAVRRAFFHNGVFHHLDQVVEFYVQRDTNPGRFYAKVGGKVEPFDDLPAEYRKNINHDPPFDRPPGAAPALDRAEVRDLVAFLGALTDADLEKKR
ncbi:MAG TPA: cytochrome c peroxidase [Polyangia bacterium]|jgi:cytochrome c peroxidase